MFKIVKTVNLLKLVVLAVVLVTILLFWGYFNVYAQELLNLEDVPICADHGGVDCDTTHPEAFVVCKDGTVDESFIIYTVPQCQRELEAKRKDESEFLTKSGCFPPSEMGCTSTDSYNNLFNHLKKEGLADSELGEIHLSICLNEISIFTSLSRQYQQCLEENNRPDFTISGRETLPLLKTIFCPAFYGANSHYNSDLDLCLCDQNFSMSSDSKCVDRDSICGLKHGPNSYEVDGNCRCDDGYVLDNSSLRCVLVAENNGSTKIESEPSVFKEEIVPTYTFSKPKTIDIREFFASTTKKQVSDNVIKQKSEPAKSNVVTKFFGRIVSVIYNIFK